MTHIRRFAVAAVALVSAGAFVVVAGQQATFKRTMLQRGDIAASSTYEAVTARADIPPGVASGRHTHPGEEIGYVLEGTGLLEIQGQPPRVVKAGDAFLVPAGTPHNAVNNGTGSIAVISTYIVEKGKPLATPVP